MGKVDIRISVSQFFLVNVDNGYEPKEETSAEGGLYLFDYEQVLERPAAGKRNMIGKVRGKSQGGVAHALGRDRSFKAKS